MTDFITELKENEVFVYGSLERAFMGLAQLNILEISLELFMVQEKEYQASPMVYRLKKILTKRCP